MIKTSSIACALFALAAAVVATPIAAQEIPTAAGQQTFQERVHYDDLDLRQVKDQRTLKSRVRIAIHRVCRKAGDTPPHLGLSMEGSCVGELKRQTRSQLIAAIDAAKSGQQAVATNLVVSTPRI